MPRKFLKRLLPNREELKKHRVLQGLGERIHDPDLWHLNRRSAATATAVGLFLAFIPIPGQMFIAAILAFYFRCNLAISVLLVWITNPLTMPPIFYAAYVIGSWLLMDPASNTLTPEFNLSLEWFQTELQLIWKPFMLGCLVMSIVSAILGYFLVRGLWRWHVINSWKERLAARKARRHPHS